MSWHDAGRGNGALYAVYAALTTVVCLLLSIVASVSRLSRAAVFQDLRQRLARYAPHSLSPTDQRPVLWLHAASVGEVQAAKVLIDVLLTAMPDYRLVVTTMTVKGREAAQRQLPGEVCCLLAPLDGPAAVRRACKLLNPSLYLCLETELWPVTLLELKRLGVKAVLLNGRLSERSCRLYLKTGRLIRSSLGTFERLAVITGTDRDRFLRLGVAAERIEVSGNLKYDQWPENPAAIRQQRRQELQVNGQTVFVCGSTRSGEEQILLPVYRALAAKGPTLWVLAPRHLQRLAEVQALLDREEVAYTLYSALADGRQRCAQVVLIDCMGELAEVYAAGDLLFCGGSLVPKGGHNIMEAARWGRPVYFGPSMRDFQDAAALLVKSGGGFQVNDGAALRELVLVHLADRSARERAGEAARDAAATQRGAAARQVNIVREVLSRHARQSTFTWDR